MNRGISFAAVALLAIACNAVLGLEEVERAPEGSGGAGTGGTVGQGGTGTGGSANPNGGEGGDGGICEPGNRRCNFNQPEFCADDGSEWVLEPECTGDTPSCIAESGECGTCVEGTRQCGNDTTPVECDDRGAWLIQFECESSLPYCLDGECTECNGLVGPERQCTGNNTPELCVDGVWTEQAACSGEMPECIGATGLCGCVEDTRRCGDDDTPEVCNDEGEWASEPDCAADLICSDDTGECECLSEEPSCSGGVETRCMDAVTTETTCELGCGGDKCLLDTVADPTLVLCDAEIGLYCNTPDEKCHYDYMNGGARSCVLQAEGISGAPYECDSPGDCGAGEECCFDQLQLCGTVCLPTGECLGGTYDCSPGSGFLPTLVCDPEAPDCTVLQDCVQDTDNVLFPEFRLFKCESS